jgi:ornithine cyclodeaminase/alanine dehydrogenase
MGVWYLTEDEVARLLDMSTALNAVTEAFRQLAAGKAMNVPRSRAQAAGNVLHTMSAAAEYLGLSGWKAYFTIKGKARFHVALYDQRSGEMVALLQADRLGQMRTGAVTGLATDLLAQRNAHEVGLFGAGWQAESQLLAVAKVRQLKRAFVYSRSEERRTAFADTMQRKLGLEVIAVDRPQEAVEDLPIVITATSSAQPVFDGHWLGEGSLVCAVGSNWLHKAEIDVETIRRVDRVVCDSIECCRLEAGDFVEALERGAFDWSQAAELADVVAGRVVGEHDPGARVLFKSVGMAIEDVAVAARVLELAKSQGVGREIEI